VGREIDKKKRLKLSQRFEHEERTKRSGGGLGRTSGKRGNGVAGAPERKPSASRRKNEPRRGVRERGKENMLGGRATVGEGGRRPLNSMKK